MMQDTHISYATQEYIDACKKRIGANPKSLTQLKEEKNWRELKRNFWKLQDAIHCKESGTLVLIDGAEL